MGAIETGIIGGNDLSVLQQGRDFETLVKLPAWKLLLDWLEVRTKASLTTMYESLSTDPMVMNGLKQNWRNSEGLLHEIQKHVYDTIEIKRVLVQALLESGMTPQQLEIELAGVRPDIIGGIKNGG